MPTSAEADAQTPECCGRWSSATFAGRATCAVSASARREHCGDAFIARMHTPVEGL
ncbi:MAG TPA: hypothetical protein VGL02_28535 [Streptomyces sp.]